MDEQEFFRRLAELAVRVGTNLQPGQELVVFGDVEHAPLVRATMEAGWRAGASDVQCLYRDPFDRLFLGRYAADDRLERSSLAMLAGFDHLAEGQRALVWVTGDAAPDLYAEIDPERLARIVPAEAMRRRAEIGRRRGFAWTLIPFPTEAWSARIFGEPDVGRLRDVVGRATRLDEPDPVAAWRDHLGELSARAEMLNAGSYDAMLATDDGASMVGEIALVPAHNRLSELELTFFHALFDENVSSHMALGNSLNEPGSERLTAAERRAAGMSTSIVHHDFTIGGPEIDVSGVMKDGREEPLMIGGSWHSPL